MTEDEINKKNEQIQKRKNHAKRQLEEEKRQTIEKILNVNCSNLFIIGRWKKIERETKEI